MAPIQTPRPDKNKRIKSILTFASNLEAQLVAAASSKAPGTLLYDLEGQISAFPSNLGPSVASKCQEIDNTGTSLWNICTRLRREYDLDKPQDVPTILLMARVFAFLLLGCAHESGKSEASNAVRVMKIGIKAAKNCIETKQVELALKVLEKLGAYELSLKPPDPERPAKDGEAQERQRLVAEYYVLRTALAWHQGQLHMAEHMFKKSISSKQLFDPHTAESLADVLYEMGKDLLCKQEYTLAVNWLDRAYDVLAGQELDRLSIDASELRISIIETLIKGLLGVQSHESLERARNLVQLLEGELGDKLIVLLLKLELLSSSTNDGFDSSLYSDIIHRMTRSMILSDANFRLIMFHIRKLNDKSPSLGCIALDELMRLRILASGKIDWVEKALITRMWMTTGQRDTPEALSTLESCLCLIVANIHQPISSAATLAAHTLLWKRIESNYTQELYDVAEKWCRLAMHPVFEKSGELNMARISRKLLLCALARQDIGSAREIFGSMSDVAKNEPMTRFLMYKIAIRCGEVELAAECLQLISSSSEKDLTLLYACVLDAQQAGDKTQTLAALQLVLEKYGYGAHSSVHLPSLLRLTINLTITALEEAKEGQDLESNIEKICKLFEGAVASMRKTHLPAQSTESLWTIPELEWFSKNAYNLAIKHLSSWTPQHSLRMLGCCISFIDQYPTDIGEQVSDDLSLRKMFCEFSASTALIALARGEDNIEVQLQDYLHVRKYVGSFDIQLQEKRDKIEDGPSQDLHRKLAILLAFDFEAACQLKAWDDLGEVILKAEVCKSSRVYELMADCILASQAPTQVLITTLKKIANEAWTLDSLDSTKLAKYMRCLFQVALSDNPLVAEQLLDQIYYVAEESSETDAPYPSEELEWVATRAFNHAVDLYCSDDDDGCRNWAGKALNIARFCPDNGALERVLQAKLLGLKFDT